MEWVWMSLPSWNEWAFRPDINLFLQAFSIIHLRAERYFIFIQSKFWKLFNFFRWIQIKVPGGHSGYLHLNYFWIDVICQAHSNNSIEILIYGFDRASILILVNTVPSFRSTCFFVRAWRIRMNKNIQYDQPNSQQW